MMSDGIAHIKGRFGELNRLQHKKQHGRGECHSEADIENERLIG